MGYPLKDYNEQTSEARCEVCGLMVHYASLIELGGSVRCLECQDRWDPNEIRYIEIIPPDLWG